MPPAAASKPDTIAEDNASVEVISPLQPQLKDPPLILKQKGPKKSMLEAATGSPKPGCSNFFKPRKPGKKIHSAAFANKSISNCRLMFQPRMARLLLQNSYATS
jgi:hypothetical protein